MQITIIDVGTPQTQASKSGKSYQVIEVTYKGQDGRVANKKLMSFTNPEVFKAVQGLQKGEVLEVVTVKEGEFWQWKAIGSAEVSTPTPTGTVTKTTGSTYETKEERAIKQQLIVRQSSLSNAISILSIGAKTLNKDSVVELAEQLNNWVYDRKETTTYNPATDIADIADDIPY